MFISQSNYKMSIQKLQLANQVVLPSYIFRAKNFFMSYKRLLFKTKQIRVRKKEKKSEKDILTETWKPF